MNEEGIKKFWLNVSAYYRQQIENPVITMYAFDCKNVPLDDLRRAFEIYRNSDRGDFMPVPAALKRIINPPIDENAEANEAVSKIISCMKPFLAADEARAKMGELAWAVVQSMGGWARMGQLPPPDGYAIHNMREMARSKIIRTQQGRANQLPGAGIKALLPDAHDANAAALPFDSKVLAVVTDAFGLKPPL